MRTTQAKGIRNPGFLKAWWLGMMMLLLSMPGTGLATKLQLKLDPWAVDFSSVTGETNAIQKTAVEVPFEVVAGKDRVYFDFPVDVERAVEGSSLVLSTRWKVSGDVGFLTLHLRSGDVWYTAGYPLPGTDWHRVQMPISQFRDDRGAVCDRAKFARVDAFRVSIWSNGNQPVTGVLTLLPPHVMTDVVALANVGEAARVEGCRNWLRQAGIPYTEIDGTLQGAEAYSIIFLPSYPEDAQKRWEKQLADSSASGTAYFVFYTGSRHLGKVLGIEPGQWMHASREPWTGLVPVNRWPGFEQGSIPHETLNLIPPAEGLGAKAVAYWESGSGADERIPACVVSKRGAWFAHIAPSPTPAACEWLRRLCFQFSPELVRYVAQTQLQENDTLLSKPLSHATQYVARIRQIIQQHEGLEKIPQLCAQFRSASASQAMLSQGGVLKECHGVWDSRMPWCSPTERRKRWHQLHQLGIDTVFAFVQRGLVPSVSEPVEGLVSDAAEAGLALHAWIHVFGLDGLDKAARQRLQQEGRLGVHSAGYAMPWLCPDQQQNRAAILESIQPLLDAGVAGIHLDYIRQEEGEVCVCAESRKAFERKTGLKATRWPADVLGKGRYAEAYSRFQTESISELVESISKVVKRTGRTVVLSAAIFPDQASAKVRRQDWATWATRGWVDMLCPMIYVEDAPLFQAKVDAIRQAVGVQNPVMVVPGIGTHTSAVCLDPWGVVTQIQVCRQRKLAGFSFFQLDDALLYGVLPYLQLTTASE